MRIDSSELGFFSTAVIIIVRWRKTRFNRHWPARVMLAALGFLWPASFTLTTALVQNSLIMGTFNPGLIFFVVLGFVLTDDACTLSSRFVKMDSSGLLFCTAEALCGSDDSYGGMHRSIHAVTGGSQTHEESCNLFVILVHGFWGPLVRPLCGTQYQRWNVSQLFARNRFVLRVTLVLYCVNDVCAYVRVFAPAHVH